MAAGYVPRLRAWSTEHGAWSRAESREPREGTKDKHRTPNVEPNVEWRMAMASRYSLLVDPAPWSLLPAIGRRHQQAEKESGEQATEMS